MKLRNLLYLIPPAAVSGMMLLNKYHGEHAKLPTNVVEHLGYSIGSSGVDPDEAIKIASTVASVDNVKKYGVIDTSGMYDYFDPRTKQVLVNQMKAKHNLLTKWGVGANFVQGIKYSVADAKKRIGISE